MISSDIKSALIVDIPIFFSSKFAIYVLPEPIPPISPMAKKLEDLLWAIKVSVAF